uniref:Uncharacterized protein n=1 Tax=Arundo donax TaxID=35708 RepID=A0A0A9D1J0_ARUDO
MTTATKEAVPPTKMSKKPATWPGCRCRRATARAEKTKS